MEKILINVLFILVLLFITLVFLDWQRKRLHPYIIRITIYFSSLVGIIFCMTFPILVKPQFIFDLRVVPFMIGSIYGGPIVSIALYFFILFYRIWIGIDLGLLGAALNYGILTILLVIFSRYYIRYSKRVKLLIAITFIGTHIILSHIIFTQIFYSGLSTDIFWKSSLIKVATIILFVLTLEAMQHYYKLRIQLDALEKMELVYHLSASISHEVRNGLTSSKGFLQLLNEIEPDPQKRKYLRIAIDELDRTENIVRDFLTFAKPYPKQIKKVRLDHFINSTLTLIEPLANMHSIVIRKNIIPSTIRGDESMIQQSLLNIFKNAIEAMPDGGVLEIDVSLNKNRCFITIKDTGVGMNADQITRLGTPYFSTKGQKGTGLGMMVAFRVIEELNGTINVESQIGKGTIFRIQLPCSLCE